MGFTAFSARSVALCGVAAVLLSACTGTPAGLPAAGSSASSVVTSPPAGSSAAGSPPTESTVQSPPSPTAPPKSQVTIGTVPTDAAAGVPVLEPVVVRATGGTLNQVAMTNPEGQEVTGALSADGTTWTSAEPLGYGRTYAIDATAQDPAGLINTSTSSFTTVEPVATIFPSFEPPPDRGVVGVGQPISVIFDKAPPDKAAAERALTVTTLPEQMGGWYWVDDRTVHYRPKDYWQAGTQITVTAKVYGVDLGGGMYGETDRTLNLTIGQSKIATVDDATKQMTVSIDGQVVRQYPVSMGRDESITVDGEVISFVTPSGIYVAQEKYPVKQMNSATYGLPTSYDLGYDSAIPLAVRLSNSGIFAHSAPWSVADQGIRDVSHGCINMPPEDAQWFYDTFSYGDIVQVTGTSTQLAPDDGYGDWNIPWDQWQQGSALN
jgi:lipoprotein-anchoring transpeptidase ErfK/SrfK